MERPLALTDTGLGHDPDDYKRDGRTVYVSHPDGKLATRGARKGQIAWARYRRTSSLGDITPEPLIDWRCRHIAYGMTLTDHPLPADLSDRSYWDGVVAAAEAASGANLAADRGTHIHEQCARASVWFIDNGNEQWEHLIEGAPDLGIDRDATINAVHGFRAMCVDRGLTPLKVEAKIVNDNLECAGTCDYFFAEDGQTDMVAADLKGSKRVRPSYGCQLYGYATGRPYLTHNDTRADFPWPVNTEYGYILQFDREHLVEHGTCDWDVYKVDYPSAAALLAKVDAVLAETDPANDAINTHLATHTAGTEPEPVPEPAEAAPVAVSQEQVAARFGALADNDRARVRALRSERGIADDDYPAILALVDEVDAFNTDAGTGNLDRWVAAEVTNNASSADPDEGDHADPTAVEDLQRRFFLLDERRRDAMQNVVASVGNLSLTQRPSVRRWNLGASLVKLAEFGDPQDLAPLVTAVELATGRSYQYASVDDSVEILDCVNALAEGRVNLHIADNGAYKVVPS